MHLPSSSARDRVFYAQFYSRHPSEIEIIDQVSRTFSESPTTLTPLSDVSSSVASGFFSSSDCSSSESTSSFTKRRRPTAPTIQERLNTYESACTRPTLPTSSVTSKQKPLSPVSLVSQIITHPIPAEQIKPLFSNASNLVDNDTANSIRTSEDNSSCSLNSRINEKSYSLDSSKRYLSKSTSQLCDQSSTTVIEEQVPSSSRNILEVIQEELSEIRRADHDLKKMFLSIYGKIQNIQQLKSTTVQQQKGQRHHYQPNDRPSRSVVHCCYSSNSDIRRMSCNHHHHHHHNRKHALHTVAALRNRTKNARTSSTADNDSYVDTDSSSSSSDSGTCSSPVDNGPCLDE